uniref:Uncharacterized protein n=1 Tax=Haptolina brevifila TaxID=156173 RepID=A0A6U7M9M9_9EUKA|mmetsp:Transcript_78062/g.155143  ORF Transcript_78062/g.155143 Transcript_78062/m.155143 type:complete len:273 (+) Transcript_78062:324-1142(+)
MRCSFGGPETVGLLDVLVTVLGMCSKMQVSALVSALIKHGPQDNGGSEGLNVLKRLCEQSQRSSTTQLAWKGDLITLHGLDVCPTSDGPQGNSTCVGVAICQAFKPSSSRRQRNMVARAKAAGCSTSATTPSRGTLLSQRRLMIRHVYATVVAEADMLTQASPANGAPPASGVFRVQQSSILSAGRGLWPRTNLSVGQVVLMEGTLLVFPEGAMEVEIQGKLDELDKQGYYNFKLPDREMPSYVVIDGVVFTTTGCTLTHSNETGMHPRKSN